MQEIDGVGGSHPLTPEETQRYREDYDKSFQLFQNAFEEYRKKDVEFHKKQKFKQVMDEALNVMNETASVALKEGKMQKEMQLQDDYEAYIKNPSNESEKTLLSDIEQLK